MKSMQRQDMILSYSGFLLPVFTQMSDLVFVWQKLHCAVVGWDVLAVL